MSAFIDAQKAAGFAVELICRTIGVSRSAYCRRSSGQRSARAVADEQLVEVIRQGHEENFEATATASCTSRLGGAVSRSAATASSG